MLIPEWFEKELKIIDPSYRAEVEENLVAIVKDVHVKLPLKDGGTAIIHGPRTIDVFEHPSHTALEKLRKKKYEGQRMNIVENPLNELRWLRGLEEEAKKKREQLAIDMMAEGLMKMHRLENTKTFVMPGGKDGE